MAYTHFSRGGSPDKTSERRGGGSRLVCGGAKSDVVYAFILFMYFISVRVVMILYSLFCNNLAFIVLKVISTCMVL